MGYNPGSQDWSVKPMTRQFGLADFDYALPDELIAQEPLEERAQSRLLHLSAGGTCHRHFGDIVSLLGPDDLLVVNDTRVVKARVFAHKDSGGGAEILLERTLSMDEALCQVRVSKPLKPGRELLVGGERVTCVGREGEFYRLRFPRSVAQFLEDHGHMPLPPYIKRDDEPLDESRYQTVYGERPGAVAAPTAGLHFSEDLLECLRANGTMLARVTLHVGAGTFQPVRSDDLREHKMHREWCEVPQETAEAVRRTRRSGGSVVAVGTTVVRTLESAALRNEADLAGSCETDLFITPDFQFKVVDKLVTNFHLPKSTLLMLVCAFGGYDRVMAAYREAVQQRYRFFSYGDAMFLERGHV
jgi:S-adenosylmethionine:tRNA ribosyltransferase-isomerase